MKRHRGRRGTQRAKDLPLSKDDRLSFELQDRDTADYAYGGYGHRKPGHARSDPYPVGPDTPDGAESERQ
ncbi:hypothetical protein [Taklimakanibacter deserti]|uniref:hypothetical protein n=1 Tax=Taklimakanibacter deserti TaxID=2267839 RepID=UPI0013C4E3C6